MTELNPIFKICATGPGSQLSPTEACTIIEATKNSFEQFLHYDETSSASSKVCTDVCLFLILSQLKAQDAINCRRVCKQWYHISTSCIYVKGSNPLKDPFYHYYYVRVVMAISRTTAALDNQKKIINNFVEEVTHKYVPTETTAEQLHDELIGHGII